MPEAKAEIEPIIICFFILITKGGNPTVMEDAGLVSGSKFKIQSQLKFLKH